MCTLSCCSSRCCCGHVIISSIPICILEGLYSFNVQRCRKLLYGILEGTLVDATSTLVDALQHSKRRKWENSRFRHSLKLISFTHGTFCETCREDVVVETVLHYIFGPGWPETKQRCRFARVVHSYSISQSTLTPLISSENANS